jgi:hypothetical protein
MVTGSRLLVLCGLLRMCSVHANCTACAPWQYETVPCSGSMDRVCTNHTAQMVTGTSCHERPTGYEDCCPGQYWTAGWVRNCHDCQGEGEYSDGNAQNACHKCNYDRCNVANTYTVAACNHEHDTICASCTICNTDAQYETSPCTNTNRLCLTTTTCNTDNYASVAPTPTSDRVCAQCTACAPWQYETLACSQGNDRECTDCTACALWQYQTTPCSSTADRVCTNHTACVVGQTYQTRGENATVDRICSNCTLCANGSMVN